MCSIFLWAYKEFLQTLLITGQMPSEKLTNPVLRQSKKGWVAQCNSDVVVCKYHYITTYNGTHPILGTDPIVIIKHFHFKHWINIKTYCAGTNILTRYHKEVIRTIHTDDSDNSVTLQQVVIAAYNIFLSSLSYTTNVKLFEDNL